MNFAFALAKHDVLFSQPSSHSYVSKVVDVQEGKWPSPTG